MTGVVGRLCILLKEAAEMLRIGREHAKGEGAAERCEVCKLIDAAEELLEELGHE